MDVQEVCIFYLEGRCHFGDRCRNLHPSEYLTSSVETVAVKENEMLQCQGENKKKDKSMLGGKKPPMKTANDVISRILWDSSLPTKHFVVGYLDRFLGIIEQPFAAFDWGDLSSTEYDALAIPRHRIQFFKYKGEKVWDKNERLDLVFGSTGAEVSIIEVISRIDAVRRN